MQAVCTMQGRVPNARPCAQCRAVCSMQGRVLNAGPCAQCRAVCSMQGMQGRVCSMQGRVCSMQGRVCSMQGRVCSMQGPCVLNAGPCVLNAGPCVLNAGPCAQCRAVCSMQGRLFNAGPSARRRVNAGVNNCAHTLVVLVLCVRHLSCVLSCRGFSHGVLFVKFSCAPVFASRSLELMSAQFPLM